MRLLNFLSLLSLFFYLNACKTNNTSEVFLTPEAHFQLHKNEKLADKNRYVNQYTNYFNRYSELQLPLYKAIEGNNYLLFIGIPVNKNAGYVYELLANDTIATFINKKRINDSTYQIVNKQADMYISTSLIDLNPKSSYAFFLLSSNDSVIKKNNTIDFLNQRIQYKE